MQPDFLFIGAVIHGLIMALVGGHCLVTLGRRQYGWAFVFLLIFLLQAAIFMSYSIQFLRVEV
jgi:hypothetical protein